MACFQSSDSGEANKAKVINDKEKISDCVCDALEIPEHDEKRIEFMEKFRWYILDETEFPSDWRGEMIDLPVHDGG